MTTCGRYPVQENILKLRIRGRDANQLLRNYNLFPLTVIKSPIILPLTCHVTLSIFLHNLFFI
jgi:hypothetical protein